MRQRNINILVGHLCARVAGFDQPLQVVGGQLDGIFVAAGQRVEVLPLKLLLHRIHVQTQKRAGCQPQRVPSRSIRTGALSSCAPRRLAPSTQGANGLPLAA